MPLASPTAKRRILGIRLRRYRTEAAMTAAQVAGRLDWSEAKISRMERGKHAMTPVDIRAILDVFEVTDEGTREVMVNLARGSAEKGWWVRYGDAVPEWFEVYVGLESGASELRVFASHFIHGLFQTESYAAATITVGATQPSASEVERRVRLRMERQNRLTAEPLKVRAIFGEAALRCRPGKDIMPAQLARLAELAVLPNVTVQVLPFTAAEYVTARSFNILDFPDKDDPGLVYIEHRTGGLYLEQQHELEMFRRDFELLQTAAMSRDESLELIMKATHTV